MNIQVSTPNDSSERLDRDSVNYFNVGGVCMYVYLIGDNGGREIRGCD